MDTAQVKIQKTRAAIKAVLALSGKRISRTQLVKLVYLADNSFHESTGKTITGRTYTWDRFGPNAVGNAIVAEADKLVFDSDIRMRSSETIYGSHKYEYWIEDPKSSIETIMSCFNDGERQVLTDVVKQYKNLPLPTLVKMSKKTHPFSESQQYDLLDLQQDQKAMSVRTQLASSGEFIEETELGFKEADEGDWVWEEDLDTFTTS